MAWNSLEEEVMDVIGLHMREMKAEKKKELIELYSRLIFPKQGQDWTDVKWVTHWGVTFVTMWDKDHLIKNIKFAMIRELMGLGPLKYCIVYNEMPEFSKKLLLLISYLPHKKMCLYPYQTNFDSPFDRLPWQEIGDVITS